MRDTEPLYNSRVPKIYLEYITKNYPDIDTEYILKHAGMSIDEIEDQAHWFTQVHVDRFQEAAVKLTGNKNIAREAGRFAASSQALGVAKQYMLGLMNLSTIYILISKVHAIFSRAASIKSRKISSSKVEITATPIPGVREKPYQCENRIGFYESGGKLFTQSYAKIEETHCIHKGDSFCRYIVSWEKKPSHLWKNIRNYSFLILFSISILLLFLISTIQWLVCFLVLACASLALCFITETIEKNELLGAIDIQGGMARDLLNEMSIRHNNSLLIQEIGQATSSILKIDTLIDAVVKSMEMHMDFDRGMIMLANKEKSRLIFKAGYGYASDKKKLLSETEFNLTNPDSQGAFVISYKNQEPFLINNFKDIKHKLSKKSLAFANELHVDSMICVPIVYENESLGIITVDNVKTKRPLSNSDMGFLIGVASQVAISITNAISFQKLQDSEKKYRDLVENASSLIIRRDVFGNVTFFNEYTQRYFGFTENEILGKNFESSLFKNHDFVRNDFNRVVSSFRENPDKKISSENECILKNDEKIWVNWTYKPLYNTENQLTELLCIGNDITELKKAELEKKQLESSLQRARKMEAIGTLAGGVAHDLNNILSGIVSYPELLLMDLPRDSKLIKPITTIQKSGERAAAIVQDLLTLARRGVVNQKVINLNTVIMDYLMSPECQGLKKDFPQIKIKHELENGLLNIIGSSLHLTKTIMNLVTNAVEAIPQKGEVLISTANKYVDRTINGFDKVSEGDYATFRIKDNGRGISPQDIERIFEPFYTSKVMGKSGTGLGMAVVWGTVKDHNGYIDIKSEEGIGTVFTLYFPGTRQHSSEMKASIALEDIRGNNEKILIVDDVKQQREIAMEMFAKLNYNAFSVSSGEEAVAYLKDNAVDLIVLDMILVGGIDGLDTYKKILEFRPNQKAIISSGYSESARVKETQRLGAGHYLKKPYRLEDFGKAIKQELNAIDE